MFLARRSGSETIIPAGIIIGRHSVTPPGGDRETAAGGTLFAVRIE
jgi:hypothetical protein